MKTDHEELARKATCEALGYKDWPDATDYRLTGTQDEQRDRTYKAILTALTADKARDGALEEAKDLLAILREWMDPDAAYTMATRTEVFARVDAFLKGAAK